MGAASSKASKPLGLILTLGGAPTVPHSVAGVPGMYRPDRATPVGGIGEASVEQAIAADQNDGCPLRLVTLKETEVDDLRKRAENDRRAERGLSEQE